MLVRRVLEWSIFIFFWLGVAPFAITFIYYKLLRQEYLINEKLGNWSSFAIFFFILIVIYFILRRLALMCYAKCKVSEKRLITNMKKEVRELKLESKGSLGNMNLSFENEKSKKKYQNNIKRGRSLDDLSPTNEEKTIFNSRSLESIRHSRRYRVNKRTGSVRSLTQSYGDQPQRYGTPPPAYHTLNKQNYYDSHDDDENEIYCKPIKRKQQQQQLKEKRARSADNVLDMDQRNYMHASRSLEDISHMDLSSIDKVDGPPKILRKAPPVPTNNGARRSKSLTRLPKSSCSKSYQQQQYNRAQTLHRSHSPLGRHVVEVHRANYYDQSQQQQRSHITRSSRSDMIKHVLVSNTLNQRKQ